MFSERSSRLPRWKWESFCRLDLQFTHGHSTGDDLLIFVANWPSPRRYAWSTLLRARAIENLSCVVGVNRVGTDGNEVHYHGDSVALDELGMPLLELGAQAQVATVVFSAAALAAHRVRFPAQMDADRFSLQD